MNRSFFTSYKIWTMTKGVYHCAVDDKRDEKLLIDGKYRLPDMFHALENAGISDYNEILDAIDCLWFVIDLLPNSNHFFRTSRPWSLAFEYETGDDCGIKFFQLVKFNSVDEDVRREIFRNIEPITDIKMRNNITRIAVIDDENHAWKVPKVGFRFVCIVDPGAPRKYRIVEKRDDETLWIDERREEN